MSYAAERRHEQALDRAIMNELVKGLSGSSDTPKFNIQRLLDASEYQMDAEIRMNALGDDDWEDVKMNRDNETLPSDHLVPLWDEKRDKTYHVWKSDFEKSRFEPKIDSNDVTTGINVSSTEDNPEGFDRQEVDKVLDRLTLENGRCLPSGYQDWIEKKLQSRFLVQNDIPGYANLCEVCHRVLTHSWAFYGSIFKHVSEMNSKENYNKHYYDIFHHYETIEALHASASVGCHLCSLLTSSQHSDTGTCDQSCFQSYHLVIVSYASDASGEFYIVLEADETLEQSLHCRWKKTPLERISTLKYATTDEPEVLNLAKRWLARCLREDGETCMMSTRFQPSRLVKITTKHDALYSARVVLQSELPTDVQYLTLSHCWGTTKMVKLEEGTYKDYQAQLPLSSLSKTFREALKVTAWLGYQYIWIDSLCILQDSTSDWENEAAKMGAIYRHSICTLTATGARNGDGGLFFKRSALSFGRCPLYQGEKKSLFVENLHIWPKPLLSRAWAVQERCLSPRVLSFGSDKMSWSCRRTEACEGLHGYRLQLKNTAFPRLLDPQTDKITASAAWVALVSQYSACDLTYWKDRWPAFQGLASEIAKARNWEIVHGLRSHLLSTTELLWDVRTPGKRTVDLGRPSWSWLNIQSKVFLRNLERSDKFDAEIILQESSAGEDSRNGIMNGVIRIEARMVEFKPDNSKDNYSLVKHELTVSNPQFEPQDSNRGLSAFWYQDTLPIPDGKMWALQIVTRYRDFHGGLKNANYAGLVVVPVEGRPGFWRRVGKYEALHWNDWEGELIYPWTHEKMIVYLI